MISFFQILKWNGFPVKAARKKYENILRNSFSLDYQVNQKWESFKFHQQNNPFYKDFLNGKEIQEWSDIPIITKADLMGDFFHKIPQIHNKKDLYVSRTSGSTGTPMMFAREKLFHVMVWLAANHFYEQNGLSVNNMQARFYGMPLTGVNYYKELVKDILANRFRFVVYDLSDHVLLKWIHTFKKKRFELMYGYTNSMVQFARYLHAKGSCLKDICPTLKGCIVTSEMCSNADFELMKEAFGVNIYNEYGASEICVIGFRKGSNWAVANELVHLEVVDSQGIPLPDKQTGRLIITLLHNKATPVVRYEIGDLASIERIGAQTLIHTLEGRSNDLGILPSGKKVPGLTFYYAVHEAIGEDLDVKEHQVIQKNTNTFEIKVISKSKLSASQLKKIEEAFNIYLEEGLTVNIDEVDFIERSDKGKFKHFISEI